MTFYLFSYKLHIITYKFKGIDKMDKETPIKYVEGFCKETCEQIIGTRGSSTKNWLSVIGGQIKERGA